MVSSDKSTPSEPPLVPTVIINHYSVSDEDKSPKNERSSLPSPGSTATFASNTSRSGETESSNSTDSPTPSTQSQESDSEPEDENPLGTLLRARAIEHADGHDKRFWPSQLLREVLTVKLIAAELDKYAVSHPEHYPPSSSQSLAKQIVSEHLMIFALLCLVSKSVCIQEFINEGVKDDDLPLRTDKAKGFRLYRAKGMKRPIQSFQKTLISQEAWKAHDRETVMREQAGFNPVVFRLDPSGQAQLQDFTSEVMLPFMKPQSLRATQQGGFATVGVVQIHPYCHHFRDILTSIKTKDLFAIKTLTARANLTERQQQEEFKKEVNMLNRFAHLRHDHLVRLLASWTGPRNSIREHCLLFPLARYDLDLYWENKSMGETNIRWIATQILGLTDALKSIHDLPSDRLKPEDQRQYGRHGDLKPENILWYDSSYDELGILVIADLGAAAVNSFWSRSAVAPKTVQHTPRYKPPECDLKGGKISRSYDIWTFGCILLELVCWCLEGKNGRQSFDSERFAPYPTGCKTDMFFDIKPALNGGYVVLVKEAVTQKIAKLHDHESCTMFLHDLLYLIEEHMIVAVSENTNRITSANLHRKLEDMKGTMDTDSGYYQKPCAMPRPAKHFDPVEAVFQLNLIPQIQDRVRGLDIHAGPTQRTKSVQQLQDMVRE